ncbi:unnamed protein product [Rotaria sp. Silwood2]|nr:unnamed protein product [Rotaria sp. Silwood2]CAF4272283.1 unnamed protein product [Rotaria sp. Silwood2]
MFSTMIEHKLGSSSAPISMAVGDLNNDQRLDIVVANSDSNSIGIFFSYGNGTFENPTTLFTGFSSQPQSVAIGDFNNDNLLDIVVANRKSHSIGIFFGYGNKTFTSQMTISTGSSSPQSVGVGDFNNDNGLDITIASPDTQNIGVIFGYGDGRFSNHITYSTGYDSNPFSIAVGDFNNDNRLDIGVTNKNTGNLGIFLGYGNGSFIKQSVYSTGIHSSPISIAIGDFNGDNNLDVATANSRSSNIGIFLGNGDGSFAAQITYSNTSFHQPYSLTVGDFNKDTRLDIAFVDRSFSLVGILLGYGNGSVELQNPYDLGSLSLPMSVIIGDFNADAKLDIVVALYGDGDIIVRLGYGDGDFKTSQILSAGSGPQPRSMAVADFNNDKHLDIVLAYWRSNSIGVLLGYGNGSFTNATTYSTGAGSRPQAVAIGDFNNDNKLDIIVANSLHGNVGIFLGYGNGSFEAQRKIEAGDESSPFSIAVGDFNNDSQLDVVVANFLFENVVILLGDGNGDFPISRAYFTDTGFMPYSIAVGDFNNDNILDIVVVDVTGNAVGVFLGNGNGRFSNQKISYIGDESSSQSALAVGDFNNDSRLDVVVAISSSIKVYVLFGHGNGSFTSSVIYFLDTNADPRAIVVDDFNNDMRPDIAVANYRSHSVNILFGYSNGSYASPTTYSTGFNTSPCSLAIGDFDNDSRLDFAVANEAANSMTVFLRSC